MTTEWNLSLLPIKKKCNGLSAEGAKTDVLFGPLCIRPAILPFLSFLFIYVCYVGLCVLWVIDLGPGLGLAKLHCGPPSVMVFFSSC